MCFQKMFASVSNGGVDVRLPAAEAANLQFSKDYVVPFEPKGRKSSKAGREVDAICIYVLTLTN